MEKIIAMFKEIVAWIKEFIDTIMNFTDGFSKAYKFEL